MSSQPSAYEDSTTHSSRNVHVSNIASSVSEAALKTWFEPFGTIVSAKIMIDVNTGKPRGYGFILFDRSTSASQAIATMNNSTPLDNESKPLRVELSHMHPDPTHAAFESKMIYVRNIPSSVSNTETLKLCQKYGKVKSFRVAPVPKRDDLMMATVEFESISVAREAVKGIHSTRPWGVCKVDILAKFADPRTISKEQTNQPKATTQVVKLRQNQPYQICASPPDPRDTLGAYSAPNPAYGYKNPLTIGTQAVTAHPASPGYPPGDFSQKYSSQNSQGNLVWFQGVMRHLDNGMYEAVDPEIIRYLKPGQCASALGFSGFESEGNICGTSFGGSYPTGAGSYPTLRVGNTNIAFGTPADGGPKQQPALGTSHPTHGAFQGNNYYQDTPAVPIVYSNEFGQVPKESLEI